ncbi:DUF4344 domain-containing metallopeptidase [Nonomuraea typhae]|uniref:DUF4344 domain-containing metallopeptidase n=1 Tax=Nonomuraea typhae TaxID=2603600 RepID=A0ABW7Z9I1_9ACTN
MNIRRIVGGAGALLIAATLTACGGSDTGSTAKAKEDGPAPTATATAEAKAEGKAVFVYEDPAEADAEIAQAMQDDKILEGFADWVNANLKLPYDLTISGSKCEQENAFYNPDEKKIEICYELITSTVKLLRENLQDEEQIGQAIVGNVMDALYHEFGHAVIDIYDLPALGKEDDAADQLSAYLLSSDDSGDGGLALGAAVYYSLMAENEDAAELPFYDEHSMNAQRQYNYLCWVYGSDTKKYADLVDNEWLPAERADRCEGEYEKLSNAWNKLLEPHRKA